MGPGQGNPQDDGAQRELLRGGLELMLLSALVAGPLYGYLLQQRVRERSAGRIKLQAGTLYPLLHRLEDARLIRSRWDNATGRKRKWYELTALGRRKLTRQARAWADYAELLRTMLAPVLDAPPDPA